MKLYTEEQVKKALNDCGEYFIVNMVLEKMKPIELPSDNEIIKGHDAKEFQFISFWAGAIWCRNYILNQNK